MNLFTWCVAGMGHLGLRYLVAMAVWAWAARAAGPELTDVFRSKSEGYASIRIPAVLVTRMGSVLAFAEGRQRPSDQAQNDLVMKRSPDGGRT